MPLYKKICPKLHKLIIKLRNSNNVAANFNLFVNYVDEHIDLILKYNSRWLTSVVDTYADHGDEIERRNALLISTHVGLFRFSETCIASLEEMAVGYTELVMLKNKQISLTESRFMSLNIDKQDTLLNLQKRTLRALEPTPVLLRIYLELMSRMLSEGSLFCIFRNNSAMPERVFPEDALSMEDNHGVV